VKGDVRAVKTDMGVVKGGVEALKAGIGDVKAEVGALETDAGITNENVKTRAWEVAGVEIGLERLLRNKIKCCYGPAANFQAVAQCSRITSLVLHPGLKWIITLVALHICA